MPIAKIIQEDLLNYCREHSNANSSVLVDLEKYTFENEEVPQMLSGQLVGNFLQSIILMMQAKKIVEVGMFTGFSALKMAEVLPSGGQVFTCELMDKHIQTAQSFFDKSEHGNKIFIHSGPAIQSLEQMQIGSFDMAFIDADKINYLEYYKRCLALVRNGGIIILDNMLWGGSVLEPKDDDAKSIRKTGDFIQSDKHTINLLLPIRDGLMLCIKNEK
jgi:caffeoyl-CoA O-methyltransferase